MLKTDGGEVISEAARKKKDKKTSLESKCNVYCQEWRSKEIRTKIILVIAELISLLCHF